MGSPLIGDDAGHGVGAVLGGGALGEHLYVIYGIQRDEVQVDPGAALVHRAAVYGEVGRRVALLAVHQDQHVIRAHEPPRITPHEIAVDILSGYGLPAD